MRQIVKEKWKTLRYGYEVLLSYEASNLGEIRSKDRFIESSIHGKSYCYWKQGVVLKLRHTKKEDHLFTDCITNNKKKKTIYAHKAVYDTFGKKRSDYVSHKNGDVQDNFIGNLYPCTHSELQTRNMYNHPKARWRLSKINTLSGYYENGSNGRKPLEQIFIDRIRFHHKAGRGVKWIAEDLELSLSSVYKYRNI